jgi:hypothetical protein
VLCTGTTFTRTRTETGFNEYVCGDEVQLARARSLTRCSRTTSGTDTERCGRRVPRGGRCERQRAPRGSRDELQEHRRRGPLHAHLRGAVRLKRRKLCANSEQDAVHRQDLGPLQCSAPTSSRPLRHRRQTWTPTVELDAGHGRGQRVNTVERGEIHLCGAQATINDSAAAVPNTSRAPPS